MKLAASQIAWDEAQEAEALQILRAAGFTGLEVAPPRVAGPQPYARPQAAVEYAARVKAEAGLALCSMQSIWYGQGGSIFGPERAALLEYTCEAIRFARAGGIPNLVFGCPKNRVLPQGVPPTAADDFFRAIGDEAARQGTVVALEANPPLYGTNFVNTTAQALELVRRVGSSGLAVNLDFGTIVENGEAVEALRGQLAAVHHVHISEPNLAMLQKRPEHRALAALLRQEGYGGWVSIEMKAQPLGALREAAAWVAEVFA